MLNISKQKDAEASNTKGEGDAESTFNVADSSGEWFTAKGLYPLIDTDSGTRFEAGVPTRATHTKWVDSQIQAGAMQAVDKPADAKGKAATEPNPAVDESPKSGEPGPAGPGMQSAVAGS